MPQHKAWAVRRDALTGQAGSVGSSEFMPSICDAICQRTWPQHSCDLDWIYDDLWLHILFHHFHHCEAMIVSDIPGQETGATQAGI